MDPTELDPMVTGRVPVRLSYDDRHFQDRYQYTPSEGYTPMFQRMLTHHNIEHLTGVNFFDFDEAEWENLIFTGGIDMYFDYEYGHLPYRSMDIDHIVVPGNSPFPVSTINYPNTNGFLRATEQGKITRQKLHEPSLWGSLIMTEAPMDYDPNDPKAEQYYPIPTPGNRAMYNKYQKLAEQEAPEVIFAGRLGSYLYIEMGQAVAHAQNIFGQKILPKHLS